MFTSIPDLNNTQYEGLKTDSKTVIETTTDITSKILEKILQKSNEISTTASFMPDAVINSIVEFLYNPGDVTFLYYRG